jgi:hypothetical protein
VTFRFRFHPTVSVQAEVTTPLHFLTEENGIITAGTYSTRPTNSHILLITRPPSPVLDVNVLKETSGFRNLPFEVGEITCEGIRIGYLFKSKWTCTNLHSGLLYVSGSWWETAKQTSLPEGEFPMLFKNADFSIFSAQNKVGLIVCGEIPTQLQDLLRL